MNSIEMEIPAELAPLFREEATSLFEHLKDDRLADSEQTGKAGHLVNQLRSQHGALTVQASPYALGNALEGCVLMTMARVGKLEEEMGDWNEMRDSMAEAQQWFDLIDVAWCRSADVEMAVA